MQPRVVVAGLSLIGAMHGAACLDGMGRLTHAQATAEAIENLPLFSCRGSLSQPIANLRSFFSGRYGTGMGRRAAGLLVALLMEALLLLLVLTLGSSFNPQGKKTGVAIVRFKAAAEQQQEARKLAEGKKPKVVSAERSSTGKDTPDKVTKPLPKLREEDASPPLIQLSPREMAMTDIAALPKRPGQASAAKPPMMGPVDTGPPVSDTPRVSGSGPNGEPLYAASWYREPYDDELRGYLSTASGPGWGLIACRTAPDYRVEDCVKIDEYPAGSNIARAVLAAAWQFRVRPPRIGGQPKIGEWVRIRIDYGFEPRSRR